MAWDSFYTSQLTSGYQGMAMNNMAYSQQIGLGGISGNPTTASQQIMGMGMNRAHALGAPVAMAGLGLMGMDPLSLGVRAGMGAWSTGGMLGAGVAGFGVGGAAYAGMAAGRFAVDQIYTGAQQQQQLNMSLGNFNFMNPLSGQRGFTNSQAGQIGQMMRGMTHQFGPAGEVVGMSELTSLAANMGRMGMGSQIRDVQEFGKKFREMVSTLKTVASELGTSLSEAQQFVSSMRGSGIFRTADQLKYTAQAKGVAFAGNLALSEVTAMGNIGSQIARSVGGLGSQGTFAGMRTIGQIGVATQMGVLSESDIYNVTGMTGAEGRQAFAASSLQRSARYLSSSRGRRTLASLAGEDGTLDEGAVAQFLAGGMTTGETMRHAHQNLAKIGRANFIRNEGRLRGAALERLGGFMDVQQLQEWASGRGIDINDMDDRSMIFAQRQLGMGREDIDAAVKMSRRMPEIMAEMKRSGENQRFMDDIGLQRKSQGLEGIKNRFNQARESVQGSLQKIGQDLFTEGSDMVERYLNRLAGNFEQRFSRDIESSYRGAVLGSSFATGQFKTYAEGPSFSKGSTSVFGGRTSSDSFFAGSGSLGESIRRGAGGARGGFTGNFLNDALGLAGSLGGGALAGGADWFVHGKSQAALYKEAGYDFSAIGNISNASQRDSALREKLAEIQAIQRAANNGPSGELLALGSQNADWLRSHFSESMGLGQDRLRSMDKLMGGDGAPAGLKARWAAAKNDAEKAQIMVNLRAGAYGGTDAALVQKFASAEAGNYASPKGMQFNLGAGMTQMQKEEAIIKALNGRDSSISGEGTSTSSQVADAAAGILGGSLVAAGITSYRAVKSARASGKENITRGEASMYLSDQHTALTAKLLAGSDEERKASRANLDRDISLLRDREKELTQDEKDRLSYLLRMQRASRVKEGEDTSEEGAGLLNTLQGIEDSKRDERLRAEGQRAQSRGQSDVASYQRMGMGTFDATTGQLKLSASYLKGIRGTKGLSLEGRKAMETFLGGRLKGAQTLSGMNYSDPEEVRRSMLSAMQSEEEANTALQGLSVSEMRKIAAQQRGELGDFETSAYLEGIAGRRDSFAKSVGRKGAGGAVADVLGVSLSKTEQAQIRKMGKSTKGLESLARKYAADIGLEGDDKAIADIKDALQLSAGNGKDQAKGLDKLTGLMSTEAAQKAREKKDADKVDPGSKLVREAITKMETTLAGKLGEVVQAVGAKDPEKT